MWAELRKLRRSRILGVAVFGLVMVLFIVAAQGVFAGSDELYSLEPEWFLTGLQSLGTLYALPGIVALLGGYIICRENQDDVLKSLLLIPINTGKMLLAKIFLIFIFSVGIYLFMFIVAFLVELMMHAQMLTLTICLHYLRIYLLDGIGVFLSTLPIICIVIERKQGYWVSLLLAEIFSFLTIFVGNLGCIAKLYPLVATFTISGYYESSPEERMISVFSMVLCIAISGYMLYKMNQKDNLL